MTTEDRFTMPPTWVRELHPRRGGVPVPVEPLDASSMIAEALDEYRQTIPQCLARCADSDIVEAGTAYLAGDPESPPLGAAVVAEIVGTFRDWRDTTTPPAFADVWLAERGPAFAAAAVAELSSLKCGLDDLDGDLTRPGLPVRRLTATEGAAHGWWGHREKLPRRVRAALAAASGADYAEAVAALARCRAGGPHHRVAASYLVPTETAWVDADCAEVVGLDQGLARILVAAISTPGQADLLAHHVNLYSLAHSLTLPATLVDGMGEEAAVPVLARWLDDAYGVEDQRRLQMMLAELPTDAAMRALIDRVGHKYGQPPVARAAARYPRRAMRLLAESGGKIAGDLLRAHVLGHPDLAGEVRDEVSAAAAQRIDAAAAVASVDYAPSEALPQVLVSPPWTRPGVVRKPVVVNGLVCADGPTVVWAPGERESWLHSAAGWSGGHLRNWTKVAASIAQAPQSRGGSWEQACFFVTGPEELAAPLIGAWRPGDVWGNWYWMRAVVARFEMAALPMAVDQAPKVPKHIAPALLPFASPEIAVLMAEWLARLKTVRPTALAWLARHPEAAARALIPRALGKAGPARRQAEQALCLIDRDTVTTAAAGYGPAAEKAITELLATDPLDLVPAKVPVVPAWADPAFLPPIRLRGGGGLPPEATRHVVTMLAISRPGEPYAGVVPVREACDGRTLAEFGWALFQRWQAAGYPSKESWILDGLALLGDDETVRRLAPLIRVWPGEGGHARAVAGLDVLATLGSEVALMHLHGIAEKVRFAGLKSKAGQKMAEVAERLGLEPQELADRLVPGFGLADDGSLTLDYGPRRFVVGFDEQLKPYVVDSTGKRLKTLPKPGVKDDAELAPAAYQRFAGLKKDVRTVAADNIRRLEQAMVLRRRWSVDDFTRLFVGHPLLWHIVRRLAWGYHDASGDLLGVLRVAEDRTFADIGDETLTLPTDVTVGIVHPLELGGALSAWAEVFADYEILQPFPQLGREVFTSVAEFDFDRLTGIPTGRVLGLERRGWRRGAPQDAGAQCWIERDVPGGTIVTVHLDPGVSIGWIDMDEEQALRVSKELFDGLDPVTTSEIMRDLSELVR